MLMSVYYPRNEAIRVLDHLVCIRGAIDDDSVGMITFATFHGKPALVGFEGAEVILKPQEAGDDGLSFESLYDTCLTRHDYQKMTRAGVNKLEDVPPALFELKLIVRVEIEPRFFVRFPARTEAEARARLNELINDDKGFVRELTLKLAEQLGKVGEMDAATAGALRVAQVAPPNTPPWVIADEPYDDDDETGVR
jgi:hypothetical protein